MGLLINKEIGTNKGITSESYVRIERYNVNKFRGDVIVDVGLYQNQEFAQSASLHQYTNPYFKFDSPESQYLSQNVDVKSRYIFPFTSSMDVSGSIVSVIDTSLLESQSVFEFAYPKLKDELESVFGVGTIIDEL